jgi:hypothetical protein
MAEHGGSICLRKVCQLAAKRVRASALLALMNQPSARQKRTLSQLPNLLTSKTIRTAVPRRTLYTGVHDLVECGRIGAQVLCAGLLDRRGLRLAGAWFKTAILGE